MSNNRTTCITSYTTTPRLPTQRPTQSNATATPYEQTPLPSLYYTLILYPLYDHHQIPVRRYGGGYTATGHSLVLLLFYGLAVAKITASGMVDLTLV